MKKSTIFMVSLVFLMVSCNGKKYRISDSRGNYYHTNSYETVEEGCIKFKDLCTCNKEEDGDEIKICGSYTITENEIEEK